MAQRDALATLCAEVQVWLKDGVAELRQVQPAPKTTTLNGTPRQKVGHA
jgi:hypothetical protein